MQLIRLAEDYSFGPFDCGEADLNDFLLADAKDYASQLLAVTYLIESTDGVAAYFALSNDSISLSDSDKATWRRIKKDFPHRKHRNDYPAVKIGRLAVDRRYQGRQIGTSIIDFVKKTFVTNNRTGCCFITVDAVPEAVGFYESNGFLLLKSATTQNVETVPMYYNLRKLA